MPSEIADLTFESGGNINGTLNGLFDDFIGFCCDPATKDVNSFKSFGIIGLKLEEFCEWPRYLAQD